MVSVDCEYIGIICHQVQSLKEDDAICYVIVSFGLMVFVLPFFFIFLPDIK